MCNCDKVFETKSTKEFIEYLVEIKEHPTEWKTLYKCPLCKSCWEASYPQSELHGGGPPRIVKLTSDQAEFW